MGRGAPIVERDPVERDRMILDNLGLAYKIASKYVHVGMRTGFSQEDVRAYAIIGLIHAVDRFDESRGFKFSPYAARCITGQVLEGINRRGSFFRPKHRKGSPGYDDWSQIRIVDADAPANSSEEGGSWGDLHLADESLVAAETEDRALAKILVDRAVEALDLREKQTIYMRFWGERVLSSIASELRISPQRVQQILVQALTRMARRLAGETVTELSAHRRVQLAAVADEREQALIEPVPSSHAPERPSERMETREIRLPNGNLQVVTVKVCPPGRARNARRMASRVG